MKRFEDFLVSLFVAVSLVLASASIGFASTATWDRNTEADMKDYDVYVCTTPGCTITDANKATLKVGVVPQPAAGVSPSFVLPNNVNGAVAVDANDTSGNSSGLSVTVPFVSTDTIPPLVPKNPRVLP